MGLEEGTKVYEEASVISVQIDKGEIVHGRAVLRIALVRGDPQVC